MPAAEKTKRVYRRKTVVEPPKVVEAPSPIREWQVPRPPVPPRYPRVTKLF